MALEVANTILAQLGGNKFRVMTGASNFTGSENALWFSLPKLRWAKDGINRICVKLEASDAYTMTFFKCRGTTVTKIAEVENVYDDSLRAVFERVTGLATTLGTMNAGGA